MRNKFAIIASCCDTDFDAAATAMQVHNKATPEGHGKVPNLALSPSPAARRAVRRGASCGHVVDIPPLNLQAFTRTGLGLKTLKQFVV